MANPIITASVVDINETTKALTGNPNILVKFFSNAQATMSAKAQDGAAIDLDMFIIRNGDETRYGASGVFYNVENNKFSFSAEDSNGNIGTATVTPEMVKYTQLTCYLANNRPDAVGNMNLYCTGNYFGQSFGAVANTITAQYRYKPYGGVVSDWYNMSVTPSGSSYSASAYFTIPNYDQNTFYTFETRVTDRLMSASATSTVKSLPMFHWGEDDFVFEVPVTFKAGTEGASISDTVEGDFRVTGNLRLKGSGNYGNSLIFGDGTYCYIQEYEDDKMMIKANRIDLSADGVYVDGYAIPILDKGTWTPYLNSSAISSYTTQRGWYSKMGQTVTVGFMIKATCNSGYSTTLVTISGLPFTPMYSAAGGGLCSGANISGGFDFQCYVAGTSGIITTRVQACNNTSGANLSTSSSGCYYPTGSGKEITLSGTITYMTNS